MSHPDLVLQEFHKRRFLIMHIMTFQISEIRLILQIYGSHGIYFRRFSQDHWCERRELHIWIFSLWSFPHFPSSALDCKTWLFDEMLYMSWIRKIPFYSNNQFTKVGFVQNGVDKTHSHSRFPLKHKKRKSASISNQILTFLSSAFAVGNRILFLLIMKFGGGWHFP